MFVYLRSFSFPERGLLLCLVIGAALSLTARPLLHAGGNQSSQQSSVTPPNRLPSKPQRLYAPHWTTQGGFQTTIYIRNVHIEQAVSATLLLVLDHRTIILPAVHIEPMETISIDVAKTLAENGEWTEQSGGATIQFDAESAGQVGAYAHVIDATRSLAFSFPFSSDGSKAAGPLEAVGFYYSKNTDGFIALQNTTEKERLPSQPSLSRGAKLAWEEDHSSRTRRRLSSSLRGKDSRPQ
jgi:hypothetical protein